MPFVYVIYTSGIVSFALSFWPRPVQGVRRRPEHERTSLIGSNRWLMGREIDEWTRRLRKRARFADQLNKKIVLKIIIHNDTLRGYVVIENHNGRNASVHIILAYAEKYTSISDALYTTRRTIPFDSFRHWFTSLHSFSGPKPGQGPKNTVCAFQIKNLNTFMIFRREIIRFSIIRTVHLLLFRFVEKEATAYLIGRYITVHASKKIFEFTKEVKRTSTM